MSGTIDNYKRFIIYLSCKRFWSDISETHTRTHLFWRFIRSNNCVYIRAICVHININDDQWSDTKWFSTFWWLTSSCLNYWFLNSFIWWKKILNSCELQGVTLRFFEYINCFDLYDFLFVPYSTENDERKYLKYPSKLMRRRMIPMW